MKKDFLKNLTIIGITTFIITNINSIPASAKWINDSQDNWKWVDGKVKTTGWKEIDKKWYYFNEEGIMSRGWLNDNGNWYNLSSSGELNTGWKKIDEKWYHFNEEGIMSIGWIKNDGTWYFTNYSGEMETGTLGIDGKVYNFSVSGALLNDKETIQEIQPGSQDVSSVKGDVDGKIRIAYVITNSDALNIRLKASTSSEIIGKLAKGEEIKVNGNEKNGFYYINSNGKTGWVSSKWISFEKPKADNSSTSLNNNSEDDKNQINNEDLDLENNLEKGEIRDTQPSLDDKHYYSEGNLFYKVKLSPPFSSGGKLIKGNCTWYAWGRAWEITGSQPNDAGFSGNAYEWWEANKKSGKYKYGSQPKVGSIAVWKSDLPNSGGCGHVAVVEKIQNGKIYISESMWHGSAFKYREIYETSYLYGYIYLDKPNY